MPTMPEATDHPANKAHTVGPNDEGYRHRYFELDVPLHDAVVWMSLLDKIVDDIIEEPPHLEGKEGLAHEQLSRVTIALKQAVDDLDAIYNKREKEEALPAAVIAAPVDPIFAAIGRHTVVRDALIEAIPRAAGVSARLEGRKVTKADEDAVEALNLDEEAAFLELFVIVPTTLEGRRALLQHFVQREKDGLSDPIGEIAERMLRLPMFAQEEARA
jgi:hypothetical protein